MNVQEYISSGIVESYVLGLASPEEQLEFENMCRQYPEVLQARTNFEIAMEQQAMQHAIAPPPSLKEEIRKAVMEAAPTAKVVTMHTEPVVHKINWLKYAVAASVVLLAGSLFWNVSLYKDNKKLQSNYDNTVASLTDTKAKLNDIEKEIGLIQQNPNVKMAALKGMPDVSPTSFATVYWDTTTKDVYLMVNNLPKPASDKQYQLWALLDGKPIDLGLIENDFFTSQKRLLIKGKNLRNAQAFAITLETKGGNPTPQGTMYTLGNL